MVHWIMLNSDIEHYFQQIPCLEKHFMGVYRWTIGQRLGTPILQQGELPSCPGESLYAAAQVYVCGSDHLHWWAPHQILIQASHGNGEGTHQVLA